MWEKCADEGDRCRGDGTTVVAEVPTPTVGDYQCLCRISACATCSGTDQKIVSGSLPWKSDYPGILGHESVGRLVEVGAKVRNRQEGEVFLRPAAVYPGDKLGDYFSLWGGFAEYGLVTATEALLEDNPDAGLNRYCTYQQRVPSSILAKPLQEIRDRRNPSFRS